MNLKKEVIKKELDSYGYTFIEAANSLIVNISTSLQMQIEFSHEGKLLFRDKLSNWNILSGIMPMSIRGSMVSNSILMLVAVFLLGVFNVQQVLGEHTMIISLLAFMLVLFWLLLWTMYYTIKSESFKQMVRSMGKP